METLLEILKYVIPSIITFLASFLVIKKFMESEERKRFFEFKKNLNKETLGNKIQAYERLILFLERISPSSIIPRIHKNGMSARYFQTELIQAIRSEFEHNLSMQVYVSQDAWEIIKNSKEEMIKLVNIGATRVTENSSSADLAKVIYDMIITIDRVPTQSAIDYLKKEFNQKFN